MFIETINVNYSILCLVCETTCLYNKQNMWDNVLIVDQLIESKYTGFTGKMRFHYITAFKTASNNYIFQLFMLSYSL